MPTYDYHCENCQHELEAFQQITEEPLVQCPKCNKNTLKRGVGGGSALFQFKGSGFYITDYKNASPSSEKSSCCPCGKKEKCGE